MHWEDEGTVCFLVEARGITVARREDNHMINGTKLLNVAGMTRGRRDGILKSEKISHIVKTGPMYLKGVWIPLELALEFANKEKITDELYPLFVHDIRALLPPSVNAKVTNEPTSIASSSGALESGSRITGPERPNDMAQNKKGDMKVLADESRLGTLGSGGTMASCQHPSSNNRGVSPSGTTTEVEVEVDSYAFSLSPSLIPPHSDSESNSSDDEQILILKKEQRAALLDRLMDYFLSMFESCHSPLAGTRVVYNEHTGSGGSETGAPSDISREFTNNGRRSAVNTYKSSRKRLPDDGEDYGDGGGSKRTCTQDSPVISSKRLACPYFKKDPGRYHTWRSCSGPGWETVHRIKYIAPLSARNV